MFRGRRLTFVVLAAALMLGAACRPPPQPAPYPGGQAPEASLLLAAASPEVSALAVPRARVKIGPHRGNLAFLAETPTRFRGSVTIAGNEVVSLSVHEEGYHLVYKLDGIPAGYYEGPPSPCAVQALLGVGLDAPRLVSLVLGGAPLIDNFKIIDQSWDKKHGRERILVRSREYEQELKFKFDDGTWRFAAATLWDATTGKRGIKLWTVTHESWRRVDDAVLPQMTTISRPGKRRDEVVTIEIKERDLNPPWARAPEPEGDTADTDGGGDPTGAGDTGDTDGGATTGDGWDDGGEWEGAPGEEHPATETPEPAPAPAPTPTPQTPAKTDPVPKIWKLTPGGLKRRGDLCKRG